MHYSLEMLVQGKREIVDFYQIATDRWGEIWSREASRDLGSLANLLPSEQMWFERHCGGRWIGQEVMVVSGLAGMYTTEAGFDHQLDKARLLYDALQSSYCSVEVKSIAEEVARSYGLLDASRV